MHLVSDLHASAFSEHYHVEAAGEAGVEQGRSCHKFHLFLPTVHIFSLLIIALL